MACCALTGNLKDCRNWACFGRQYCFVHNKTSKEVLKDRWINRFLFPRDGSVYTVYNKKNESRILSDLSSGLIVLTKEDILKIPPRDRYTDIYLFLMERGFIKRGTHKSLEFIILWFYNNLLCNYPENNNLHELRNLIERTMVLACGKTLFNFLLWISYPLMNSTRLTQKMIEYVPTLLDTDAAKELSWYTRDELDKLRIEYEKIPGKEHPITRCLTERWLPDIKELYKAEKQIQKAKMNHCKEELMMNRWHPDRITKYYELGIEMEDM